MNEALKWSCPDVLRAVVDLDRRFEGLWSGLVGEGWRPEAVADRTR
jgi:hypothetical protein